MKEIYIAPEANLVCFEATEKLANVIDFDHLWELANGGGNTGGSVNGGVTPSDGDINVIA